METGSFNCLCLTKLGSSIVFNPTLLLVRKYGVIVSSDDCLLPFLSLRSRTNGGHTEAGTRVGRAAASDRLWLSYKVRTLLQLVAQLRILPCDVSTWRCAAVKYETPSSIQFIVNIMLLEAAT